MKMFFFSLKFPKNKHLGGKK